MGEHASPGIIEDGLVLCLDVADTSNVDIKT